MLILEKSLGPIFSNVPLSPDLKITIRNPLSDIRNQYVCLDLGADEFTIGRPHPMIDLSTRIERILLEANNPDVRIILLDVVLGYGAHSDPAGALAPAIMDAKARAEAQGRTLYVVASVCGTDADPQKFSRQVDKLREAGVIIAESNADAARLVVAMLDHDKVLQEDRSHAVPPGHELPDAVSMNRPGRNVAHVAPAGEKIADLLSGPPRVLDMGVPTFADTLTQVGAPHLHIDWRPPAGGDPALGRVLAGLMDEETPGGPGALIKAANERAIERILAADPVWEDVRPAGEIWPGDG